MLFRDVRGCGCEKISLSGALEAIGGVWAKRQRDKRVFFVEIPAIDIQVEWEAEMMGGESIWDKALRYTTQWEASESAKAALVRNFA